MKSLQNTIVMRLDAHITAVLDLFKYRKTINETPLIAWQNYSNCIAKIVDGQVHCAGSCYSITIEDTHSQHQRIASEAARQTAQDTIDTLHARVMDTLHTLGTALLDTPVVRTTTMRPYVLSGVGSGGPWIVVGAHHNGEPTTTKQQLTLLDLRDVAVDLLLAACFTPTFSTTQWCVIHRHGSRRHTVQAATPGEALQWAALLHDNSLVDPTQPHPLVFGHIDQDDVIKTLDNAKHRNAHM